MKPEPTLIEVRSIAKCACTAYLVGAAISGVVFGGYNILYGLRHPGRGGNDR